MEVVAKRRTRSGGPAQYSDGLSPAKKPARSPAKKTAEKKKVKKPAKAKPPPLTPVANNEATPKKAAPENSNPLKPIKIEEWLDENEKSFVPPVCNKMMHGDGQLKVMYIGGPNERKDYHIEEGEEFFYMVKGDMCLKILEKGQPKDVHIKEGEVFVLPARIPHSPQRAADTMGLVIERERDENEIDGLRFYCDDGVTVLYQEWFHCTDLGTQIAPVVQRFKESEQCKTGKPTEVENGVTDPPLVQDMETEVDAPFSLKEWIDKNVEEVKKKGLKELFGKGEYKITVDNDDTVEYPSTEGETFLWQLKGETSVSFGTSSSTTLTEGEVLLLPQVKVPGGKYKVEGHGGSLRVSFRIFPGSGKQKK